MAWAGGISWMCLACCVYTLCVMGTNKCCVCNCEKSLGICWAVGLCECWALARRGWNCRVSALNGPKRVLKSWAFVNIFKTQPGQSLWIGKKKKRCAWKSINGTAPYCISSNLFGLSATSYCWNSVLGNITLCFHGALQKTAGEFVAKPKFESNCSPEKLSHENSKIMVVLISCLQFQ